jgi:hypothetical protein
VTDVLLAVNGTLMRGLALNPNLLNVGATFVKETTTAPTYRLWSINDVHPAMMRVATGGTAIALEVWSVPAAGLAEILLNEPPGLCIGKVQLADGKEVLGVLGEPILCEHQKEITQFGGWRAYVRFA